MEFGDRNSEKIYILKCPFSGSVRYVGKGVDLRAMKSARAKEAWSRPDVRTKQVAAIREASVKKRGS